MPGRKTSTIKGTRKLNRPEINKAIVRNPTVKKLVNGPYRQITQATTTNFVLNNSTAGGTYAAYYPADIAGGDSIYQRGGAHTIKVKGVKLDYTLSNARQNNMLAVRVLLLQSRKRGEFLANNVTKMFDINSASGVGWDYDNPTSINYNIDRDLFLTLYDRKHIITTRGYLESFKSQIQVSKYIKVNKLVRYDTATATDVTSGQLILLFIPCTTGVDGAGAAIAGHMTMQYKTFFSMK